MANAALSCQHLSEKQLLKEKNDTLKPLNHEKWMSSIHFVESTIRKVNHGVATPEWLTYKTRFKSLLTESFSFGLHSRFLWHRLKPPKN